MIAIDTNLLVYAHRSDSDWHSQAASLLGETAAAVHAWAIPWPCVHEFLAIATHPRIFDPPSTLDQALEQLEAWFASPSVQVIGEPANHWALLREQTQRGRIRGPQVHDARIAAICLGHGVRELLSADRDFSRFPNLATRNPLIG